MARIEIDSQAGIISRIRNSLNTMFTEIYAKIVNLDSNGDLILQDTVWDDLRAPFTQTKQGATLKPDFDFTNLGLLFPQNDNSEVVYTIMQMPHTWKVGTNIHPHIHWQQMNSNNVVWKMDYKWFSINSAPPAGFTTLTANSRAFTYSSGNLHQIDSFAPIDGSAITGVSSLLLIKIYRDDNVDAGAGSGDALAWEFDIHFEVDSLGSREEFTK